MKTSSKGSFKIQKPKASDKSKENFTKNIFDILKIRLALENIKFTDSDILLEIKKKLNNVNTRTIDIKFVNDTIEKLFAAMKDSYRKKDQVVLKREIKTFNINIDRTRAMSEDINKRKWLDTCNQSLN